MLRADLIIRNVRPMGGPLIDIAISDSAVLEIGSTLSYRGLELDGGGNAVLPGLHDHHIHLLATASALNSVDLIEVISKNAALERLKNAAANRTTGQWLRAINYPLPNELPTLTELDEALPAHPLRMQDRSGALWIMNSAALAFLGSGPFPSSVEIDAREKPTGRIWRGDAWLRSVLPKSVPQLAPLSKKLAAFGITGVTDTGPSNGTEEASIFEAAVTDGSLRQRLTLMGTETLSNSTLYSLGALKLHYDEARLPDIDLVAKRIQSARFQNRPVAAHCVTVGELVFFLGALDAAGGARLGDRIEHGSEIPTNFLPIIEDAGLTVISQPHFIRERGDHYLLEASSETHDDLYRLANLKHYGVKIAAGSDAPYGSLDPWAAMAAAIHRQIKSGRVIGTAEKLTPREALDLFLGCPNDPSTPRNAFKIGAPADFCLINRSFDELLEHPEASAVAATIIAGELIS
jgi:predicted amidohydrolase YtcJ